MVFRAGFVYLATNGPTTTQYPSQENNEDIYTLYLRWQPRVNEQLIIILALFFLSGAKLDIVDILFSSNF